MDYLEIDPITNIAIGGSYQKIKGTNPLEWVNWVAYSDNAGVGHLWDPISKTWARPMVSLEEVRKIRDEILLATDWRVSVSDYPNPDAVLWVTYRDLLRKFPATYTPTESPEWPEAPP